MNECDEKIQVGIDDYNRFVDDLKRKYDDKLREVQEQFAREMLLECQQWHNGHNIVIPES